MQKYNKIANFVPISDNTDYEKISMFDDGSFHCTAAACNGPEG
jgi:hypothetical protein